MRKLTIHDILLMIIVAKISNSSGITTPFLNQNQFNFTNTQGSTRLQNILLYPSQNMFREYIANFFTSSESLIQMFNDLKIIHQNIDFKNFLPPVRKRREVRVLKFKDDEILIFYQFFGRFAHFNPIVYSSNSIRTVQIQFIISEDDILGEFSNLEIERLQAHELRCRQILMASSNGIEFIVLLKKLDQNKFSITKGEISENIVDFPTVLEHIWKSYTIKFSMKKYLYKIIYFLQKIFFTIFAKYAIFCDKIIYICWKIVSNVFHWFSEYTENCCIVQCFKLFFTVFFATVGFPIAFVIILSLWIARVILMVNFYFLPFHGISLILFFYSSQSFYSLLYTPQILLCCYTIFSPMISFVGFSALKECVSPQNFEIKQSCENIKKIYEITDNEKSMSSLWPISWQLSDFFIKIKIFYYLFLICILMLVCSPQFLIFYLEIETGESFFE